MLIVGVVAGGRSGNVAGTLARDETRQTAAKRELNVRTGAWPVRRARTPAARQPARPG